MSQPVDELNFSKFAVTQVGDKDKQITRKFIKQLHNIYPEVRASNVDTFTRVPGVYAGSQHDSNILEFVSGTRGAFFRTFYRNGNSTLADQYHYFYFPLPIYKGKYILVPDTLFIDLITASATDYIDVISIYAVNANGVTEEIHDDGVNRTSPENINLDLTENRYGFFKNYGNWTGIYVQIDLKIANNNAVEFAPPVLKYYYRDLNPIGETIDRI